MRARAAAAEARASSCVGGKAGFKLVYTWKTSDGLRMKQSDYGLVVGPWLYQLTYQAAARYYFERDLTAFERVVASFRLPGNS